jgi:hypothetical protein
MAFELGIMEKELRVCLCCAASTHSSQRFGFNIPDLTPISSQSLLYPLHIILVSNECHLFFILCICCAQPLRKPIRHQLPHGIYIISTDMLR